MQPTKTSELYWYAVHVRSRHEFKVLERLTKAGIDAFLPVVERLNKWKDRKKLVNIPLFPGYLFKKLIENKEAIDPYPYLKEGQRVRIKRGLLMGSGKNSC